MTKTIVKSIFYSSDFEELLISQSQFFQNHAWKTGKSQIPCLISPFPLQPDCKFVTMKSMRHFPAGQTLLIDADDTLWENNVYFERAIAAFISYLNHHEYSPAEVRNALNAVERETILAHGYGLPSFYSLVDHML